MPDGKTDRNPVALVGYARVSTLDQDPALQLNAFAAAGCTKVFEERASGARADRPGLRQALDYVREIAALVVWKLDRLEILRCFGRGAQAAKGLAEPETGNYREYDLAHRRPRKN